MRDPVKRQITTTLAKPSIALSKPKPTSAIDPAAAPAATPTAPSTVIQPRLSHDRSRTRRIDDMPSAAMPMLLSATR